MSGLSKPNSSRDCDLT